MIRHYFKIAFRNILKYKTQNIISIVGLAVGLLCFSICMYCSRFVKATDHCFANYSRIAELSLYNPQTGAFFAGTQVALSEELRTWSMGEVEAVTCMPYPGERSYMAEISDDKSLPYVLQTIEVDTLYNKVFTPEIAAGSWEVASRTGNAVILTRSTAEKIFGEVEAAIGKHLTLSSRLSTSPASTPKTGGIVYTVQAVMEDIPLNNGFMFMSHIDALTLNDSEGLLQSPKRHNITGARTYALLTPDTDASYLEQECSKRNYTYTLYEQDYQVVAQNIGKMMHQDGAFILGLITGIIGTLILLVGLINFFHFLIGSFLNRTKEYSIFKTLGSNWRQQFCLLFVQSLVIVLISSFLVVCGIELIGNRMDFSMTGITMIFPPEILLKHTLQYVVFLVLLCAAICLAIAFRIRRISIQDGMYGSGKRRGKQWGRNFMLGIQFFICWIFVSLTTALFLQSEKTTETLFHTLSPEEKEAILSIPMDYSFLRNEEKLAMAERFRQHAGVKDILLADIAYTQGVSGNLLMTEKGNDNSWIDINIMCVPLNFFTFMNIPIKEGREIRTNTDLVMDEVWQNSQKKSVIGMSLYDWARGYTVCGICAPFQTDIHNRTGGYAFILYDPSVYIGHCYVKCYPQQQKEVVKWVEGIRREMLPESIPCQIRTFQDDLHEIQAIEYILKDIILFLALVSIIITLLGVYSSITLDTERRQKEVAIRKVNGAGMRAVIWLFARLYVTLLVVTAAITFPVVYMVLQAWRQLYTVFFNDGILYWGSIFAAVTLLTAVTVIFRILKIARLNPAEIIKNE